jgi:hypothetical protein
MSICHHITPLLLIIIDVTIRSMHSKTYFDLELEEERLRPDISALWNYLLVQTWSSVHISLTNLTLLFLPNSLAL